MIMYFTGGPGAPRTVRRRNGLSAVASAKEEVRRSPFSRRFARGFTLVEMILVLTIIGVVVAVTVPSLVRSIKGNRLRMASRAVVTAGRYARSMAVMKQCWMLVSFDLDKGTISVTQSEQRANPDRIPAAGNSDNSSITNTDTEGAATPTGVSTNSAEGMGGNTGGNLVQRLDRAKIASVEVEKGGKLDKGRCSIAYRNNGTCDPYVVVMTDESGASVTIEVDALSSVKTESGAK
jgi:prepilin-type N-terminal cleavage/methylation domain-containing protein